MMLSFLPALAMNQGIAPIVGQWIGKGSPERAKARTYTALRLTIGYMSVMGLFFGFAGGRLIALVFNPDPEVIRLGHRFLVLAAIFQTFDAVNIVCAGALRGAGDTRWMMWMTLVFAWVFFLPLAFFFGVWTGGGGVGRVAGGDAVYHRAERSLVPAVSRRALARDHYFWRGE